MDVLENFPKLRKSRTLYGTSLCLTVISEPLDHVQPSPDTKSYYPVWQRVKRKIILSIRIKKLLTGGTNLGPLSSLSSKINDDALRNYLSSKLVRLDGETEVLSGHSTFTIGPGTKLASFWNIFISFVLLYAAFVTPYLLSFESITPADGLFRVDMLIDVLFLIDLGVNFNLGYYNSEGHVITNRVLIATRYLKGWFILDCVASIPFSIIEFCSVGTSWNLLISKVRSLPKLLRLSRVLKLFKNLTQLEQIDWLMGVNQQVWRLAKVVLGAFLSLHIVACLWHFSARAYNYSPDTWVYRYGYLDTPPAEKYETSLYWGFTTLTTIGYGDISPLTPLEKGIAMVWMIGAVYLISFSVGSLAAAAASAETKDKVVNEKIAIAERFGEAARIKKNVLHMLKRNVRLENDHFSLSEKAKESMLNGLPMSVKYEVAMNIYGESVAHFPFFTTRGNSFVGAIALFLEVQVYSAWDVIWNSGEASHGIYFITNGKITYIVPNKGVKFSSLHEWQYFGDIEVVNETERKFDVTANQHLVLLLLPRRIIGKIKDEFPKIWIEIREAAVRREQLLYMHAAEMIVVKRILQAGGNFECSSVVKEMIEDEYDILIEDHKRNKSTDIIELESRVASLTESMSRLRILINSVVNK